MIRLKNIGKRFRGKYQLVTGQHFYGQILDIPDTSRVSNFFSARRYLRVHKNSTIQAGNVAIIDGSKYIVADHGIGFFKLPIYKHFKLFHVDEERDIIRRGESIDAVTGVKEKDSGTTIGTAYISVQPKSSISDSINIQTPQHTVISDVELIVDDKLGDDWVVTDVDKQLGIYVAEVKEG
jgi:hypothetical protein